jgi:hypothetical protein
MSKVFRITPKRVKRANGQVLTPDMSITVTTRSHTTTPFYNGAEEIKEQYMRMFQFDYKKACCSASDFEFEKLEQIYLNMDKLETLLKEISEIVLKEKTQQEEKRKRGENFNIFKVLGLSTSEVRLHSAFLAELLKLDGSHGMGDSFLKAFLEIVIPDFKNTFDIASSEVIIEYVIDNVSKQDEEHGGRIDILIRNDSHQAIIIENKIYAEDQPSQLRRYYNFAKDEKYGDNNFLLLYLTLDGHDASPDSLRNKDNDKVPYMAISYKEHILCWLKRCTEIAALHPLVRETIRQYIINFCQLLNIMEESNKDAVIETLMKGENLSPALNIIDVGNDLKVRIRKEFIDTKVKALADKYQLQMTYDNDALFLTKDKRIYFKKDDCEHFYYFISFETRNAWQGIGFDKRTKDPYLS